MRVKINVPATSANIGSGFDSVGLALGRYNMFDIEMLNENVLEFEGVEERFCNSQHLVLQTLEETLDKINHPKPLGYRLKFSGNIPVANGLGSSSTCIVAGVGAALMWAYNEIDIQTLLNFAIEFEGHPDNVAPAILGGVVAGALDGTDFVYKKVAIPDVYQFITLTPDFEFPTALARKALPESLTYTQTIHNISRASLLLFAFLEADDRMLKVASEDAIHQPYRFAMMDRYEERIAYCETLPIVTSFLSGAGATICVVVRRNEAKTVYPELKANQLFSGWDIQLLETENNTITIQKV